MQYSADPIKYNVSQLLGQGASAIVFKGTYDNNGTKVPVAIKTINLDKASQNIEQLQQETKILAMCNHPNICPLYHSFVHQQYLWLVMPELTLSILDLLKTLQPMGFDETIIATIMYDVLQAVSYIHNNNQIHRDIKLSNFLLDKSGNTLLSDFGVAGIIRPFSNDIRSTFVGSPLYMAPEVAANKPYDNSCDIWSIGICLYQLAHGTIPHENCQAMEALLKVIQQDPPKVNAKKNFSKQFKEIVDACLVKNPKERMTADQLLQFKFWQKKVEKSQIVELIKEYQVMKQQKPGAYQEQIDMCNNILQSKQVIMKDNTLNFDYSDDEQPVEQQKTQGKQEDAKEAEKSKPQQQQVQKKEESPQLQRKQQDGDQNYDHVVNGVQQLISEIKRLKDENQKLKDENNKYKDRLKMFMNSQNQ